MSGSEALVVWQQESCSKIKQQVFSLLMFHVEQCFMYW